MLELLYLIFNENYSKSIYYLQNYRVDRRDFPVRWWLEKCFPWEKTVLAILEKAYFVIAKRGELYVDWPKPYKNLQIFIYQAQAADRPRSRANRGI